MMLRRAAMIWLMHSLAFVAGLVLSSVVAGGLWTLVPAEGATWLVFGLALSVSILAVGAGYGLYLTLVGLLLAVELGWAFFLAGPLVVLAVMACVYLAVYSGLVSVGMGAIAGYVLLFGLGGAIMTRRVLRHEDAA